MESKAYLPNILDPNCASRHAIDLVADKWTALVVYLLADRTMRYSDLKRELPGISHKMLTQTLRKLERARLVDRTVYPVVPPMVEYTLTPLGTTLVAPLTALSRWAEEHAFELYPQIDQDNPMEIEHVE